MSNVWTIARRELNVYFSSPIAYIVLAMFSLIFGYFFASGVAFFQSISAQAAMNPGMAPPMNVNQFVIQPTLGNFTIILLFLMPMVTMRLFAEEQRQGTIELLLTSPVTDYEIILGKWLGAVLLYGCMLGLSLISMAVLFLYTRPDWKALLAGYLGMLLIGSSLLAIGAFLSTLTKNQIVAGALTFGLFLLLWVLDWVSQYSTSMVGKVCSYLAMPPHFEQFTKGVIELKDVVYYLSAIFLGLFLSKRSIESMRWKA
ncbi:MAG: ABC transporter permease subunit [Acidobacteria bacterium]|nr:ABC transporter permease subunit [Acidobacteriota bacterium]